MQNVSAGRIQADSLDAVNGSQLYAAIDEINTNGTRITNLNTKVNTIDGRVATNTADNIVILRSLGFTQISNVYYNRIKTQTINGLND